MSSSPSPLQFSEPDEFAWLRALAVLGGIMTVLAIYCCIKSFRASQASRSRIRKYDIVTAQHLQTGLMEDSDSEDDIFSSVNNSVATTGIHPPSQPITIAEDL